MQYNIEKITALLEKAASEIEVRDAKIEELERKLNALEQSSSERITKTASFDSFNGEDDMYSNWGSLGEASNVRTPSGDAKKNLEDFLSSLV